MTTNSKAVFPWVPASKGKTASVKFRENSNIVGGYGQEDNSAPAQRSRILSHLQCGPLTTLQARAIGIMHPAARTMELRKRGHDIRTTWTSEYCSGGVKHRVARYTLLPERQLSLFDLGCGGQRP